MAKTKTTLGIKTTKSDKDVQVKTISSVKAGAVTKPSQTSKSKSKEMAKQVAAKADKVGKEGKKSKKAKKEPTPEPSSDESDSDEEMDSTSSASSDDSDAEAKPGAKTSGVKVNGSTKPATAVEDESSDSSSSSDDEKAAARKSVSAPAEKKGKAAKAESDSEDDSEADSEDDSEDDNEESSEDDSADKTPAVAGAVDHKTLNGALAKVSSKDASSDDDSDSEGSSESGSEEDSSEDDSAEEKAPAPKKRKAEAEPELVAKKVKTEAGGDDVAKKNLFVGSLSWNVDEDWLTREFESFGELAGVRVITDKATGRSKGFGYVEFVNSEDGITAQKAMHGAQVDNRALNVDFSNPKEKKPDRSKQFGDEKSPPSDTLFVANIAFEATEDIIGEEFGKHGDVIGVRLPTDMESGNPKGFGYVQFSSVDGAGAAMDKMAGASICGRPIRLDFSTPRPSTGDSPRGGRGGRGGFDRGGRGGGRGRGSFDRGGRGGGRGGRGGRGGSTNRGGFGDFQGKKMTF